MLQRNKLFYIALPVLTIYLALLLSGTGANYEKIFALPYALPVWMFGLIWVTMCLVMGISAFKANKYLYNRIGNIFYYTQLFLMFIWFLLLFCVDFKIAFAAIILAIGFALSAMREFYNLDRKAGLIMLSYILWVIYLAVINFFICLS